MTQEVLEGTHHTLTQNQFTYEEVKRLQAMAGGGHQYVPYPWEWILGVAT